MNLLENEDFAQKRFQQAVTDEDSVVCYDMSLKEFEHFTVHNLFKVLFYYFTFVSSCHILHTSSNHHFQPIVYTGHVKVHGGVQAGY